MLAPDGLRGARRSGTKVTHPAVLVHEGCLRTHVDAKARTHARRRTSTHARTQTREHTHRTGSIACLLVSLCALKRGFRQQQHRHGHVEARLHCSPVLEQMWQGAAGGRAQSRCRCGRNEPSPGADVAGARHSKPILKGATFGHIDIKTSCPRHAHATHHATPRPCRRHADATPTPRTTQRTTPRRRQTDATPMPRRCQTDATPMPGPY